VILCAMAALSTGAAEPGSPAPSLQLEWEAPPPCPGQAEVVAEVARLVGRRPRVPADRLLVVRARASAAPDGSWQLQMILATRDGIRERTLKSRSCAEVADAAALIMAMAIDPAAALAARPQPPEPGPAPEARSWFAVVRGGAAADAGMLPGLGPGVIFGAGAALGGFSIEAQAAYWPPRRADLPGRPGVGGELRAWSGGLQASWWRRARVEGGLVAGVDAALYTGTGYGVTDRATAHALSLGVVAGPAVRWRIGERFALRLDSGLGLMIIRPRFTLQDLGTVFQPGALVGRALFAAELFFS